MISSGVGGAKTLNRMVVPSPAGVLSLSGQHKPMKPTLRHFAEALPLGTATGDRPLGREQIWLTEKRVDGATELYPLTDAHPRKEENLERGYRAGRSAASHRSVPARSSAPSATSTTSKPPGRAGEL
jgi:hypothetical protein